MIFLFLVPQQPGLPFDMHHWFVPPFFVSHGTVVAGQTSLPVANNERSAQDMKQRERCIDHPKATITLRRAKRVR